MDDRIPTPGLEGRVKITKEDGTSFLAFLEMADNPSNPGTPISKATLLKDATAAMFGLDNNAVPDDVLVSIKTMLGRQAEAIANGTKIETGSYVGTGTFKEANPNTLTFSFAPKFVIVAADYLKPYDNYWNESFIWFEGNTGNVVSSSWMYINVSGSTMTYYTIGSDPNAQCNTSGTTYRYIAIG